MNNNDPRLNLPKRDATGPAGDFALPKSESSQPAAPAHLPPAGELMNLSAPAGDVKADASATAIAANEFTFTTSDSPACADEKLRAVKHEPKTDEPAAKLDIPPLGLTY